MTNPAPAWYEKTGNTNWVKCAGCSGWFHVANSLLAKPDALLHCPHCHNEFTAEDAGRVVRPT